MVVDIPPGRPAPEGNEGPAGTSEGSQQNKRLRPTHEVKEALVSQGAAAVPAVGLTGSKRRTAGGEHVYAAQAECVDWNAKWAAEPRPLGEVYGPEVAALVAERASPPQREAAWEHWRKLGRPRFVVAPMVDQSELAFRALCRKYGAEAAYTPMLHSRLFAGKDSYRKEMFTTCPEDRPLFVQFCTNDPADFVQAASFVQDQCDYVDINLGCPQRIAKRGNYGAFLMDDVPLIERIVRHAVSELRVPISVKIRVFPDVADTIRYARRLEAAGASLVCVHGRTREQKQTGTYPADWDQIRAVREALTVPVLANGNVRSYEDAVKCIEYTGVEGVMSAEQLLEDPKLFARRAGQPETARTAVEGPRMLAEYLEEVRKYPTPKRMIKAHTHRLLGEWLQEHMDLQHTLSKVQDVGELTEMAREMERRIAACGREYPAPQLSPEIIKKREARAAKRRAMEEQAREESELAELERAKGGKGQGAGDVGDKGDADGSKHAGG